ncbi:hypothetical protein EPO66_04155 [bacterium]|nr:MAG: hypothetical protein EPO66_04155 [bacterium]
MFKILVFLFFLCFYQEVFAQQQFNDFTMAGFGEKGKKSWDLRGKSAEIIDEVIKLDNIVSNFYGEKDKMQLTADKGNYNKTDGKLHLEDNVVVTINKETPLLGDDPLNPTQAPKAEKVNEIIITCDGPVEMEYKKKVAIFNKNVKVNAPDILMYSDVMEVYFGGNGSQLQPQSQPKPQLQEAGAELAAPTSFMGTQIDKIRGYGNVKIVRGENISYSDEAIYTTADNKLTLSGKPQLVIHSTEGLDASAGSKGTK